MIERRGEQRDPAVERTRLEEAIERARQELAELAAASDGMGAEILEFQLELLEDPTFLEEALASHRAGRLGGHGLGARPRPPDPGLRGCRGRVFPGTGRRSRRPPRPRPARARRGRGPRRRRCCPAAIVVGDDLSPSRFLALDWSVMGGRGAGARQPVLACRHAGARPRRADGDRARRGAGKRRGRPRCRGGAPGRASGRGHPRPLSRSARPATARRGRGHRRWSPGRP